MNWSKIRLNICLIILNLIGIPVENLFDLLYRVPVVQQAQPEMMDHLDCQVSLVKWVPEVSLETEALQVG